jgi:hypothetical protein
VTVEEKLAAGPTKATVEAVHRRICWDCKRKDKKDARRGAGRKKSRASRLTKRVEEKL